MQDALRPSRASRGWLDNLSALLLLWNVLAGLAVAMLAPFMVDTPLLSGPVPRESAMAYERFGLYAIELPTHYAGFWLPLVGLTALGLFRKRDDHWHFVAAAFYLPQTIALFGNTYLCWWMGIFASVPVNIAEHQQWAAFNVIALVLTPWHLLSWQHARTLPIKLFVDGVLLIDFAARAFLRRSPATSNGIAWRFAGYAALCTLLFLPLFPADLVEPLNKLVLLPVVAVSAYAIAYLLSGATKEAPRFGARQGAIGASLSYFSMALFIAATSRETATTSYGVFAMMLYAPVFVPLLLTIPAAGVLIGHHLRTSRTLPR